MRHAVGRCESQLHMDAGLDRDISRDRDGIERAHTSSLPSLGTQKNMPPEPLLTSAGWSLNGLIVQGHRFREIPRVSVSDEKLDETIRNHESSGVPLVIEGMHEHQAWPTAIFDTQWLRENSKQRELGPASWLRLW